MNDSKFTENDLQQIRSEYELLMHLASNRCRSEEELQMVRKAFEFANGAHKNVRRRSGEPYIIHPMRVAGIVIKEIGLGYKSIVTALLHDVVEDTDYTVEDIRSLFGDKIATLVDGLTKIKTVLDNEHNKKDINYSQSVQAENLKRILLTLNDDVRVVLIKLADRLHNCRTIEYMPENKRDKILSETMFIFIPLAHRLGLYSVKSEMENIWLKYKEPEAFRQISDAINAQVALRSDEIDGFIKPINDMLSGNGIEYELKKRIKTPYSVWYKMTTKKVPFEEIYDLFAIRIIYTPTDVTQEVERRNAYMIYSDLTSLYRDQPSRTRDWIKNPKSNGYEALHCTLMSKGGFWVEVQIRSRRMNDIDEKGIAAHWAYKNDGYISPSDAEMSNWLAKVQEILCSEDVNTPELLDIIHKDLVGNDIVVFTPRGEQKSISTGATALDFAYSIHTHIGNSAIAAKVNMKLVPLSQVLHSGDQVEIITAKNATPKTEWLHFLKTHHARKLVLEYIRDNSPQDYELARSIVSSPGTEAVAKNNPNDHFILNDGSKYIFSSCCNPIPGDAVVGVKSSDGTIVLHKKSCPIVESLASKYGNLLVVPKWVENKDYVFENFPATVRLKGIDRMGLCSDISHYISLVMGVNMRKVQLMSDNGLFEGSIEMLVKDRESLDKMIKGLKNIDGLFEVTRNENV